MIGVRVTTQHRGVTFGSESKRLRNTGLTSVPVTHDRSLRLRFLQATWHNWSMTELKLK